MKNKKKQISVRIRHEVYSKIKAIAFAENRTLSGQVLYLINQFVRGYTKK